MGVSTTVYEWLLWAACGVFAANGLWVLVWSLVGDRARGRLRCPKCWYRMEGAVSLTCPECGHVTKSDRGLKRTRRRWSWTGVAMALLLMSYASSLGPRAIRQGWPSAIPSWALVTVWPVSVDDWFTSTLEGQVVNSKVVEELRTRILNGKVSDWEARWWIDRVRNRMAERGRLGDGGARATLDALKQVIVSADIVSEPLEDVIKRVGAAVGGEIDADWASLEPMGVGKDRLVSLELKGVDGQRALDILAGTLSTGGAEVLWVVDGKRVALTAGRAPVTQGRVCLIDLRPLFRMERSRRTAIQVGSPPEYVLRPDAGAAESIRTICERLVWVDGWISNGGDIANMTCVGSTLVVVGPSRVVVDAERMVEMLERSYREEMSGASVANFDEVGWGRVMAHVDRLEGTRRTVEGGTIKIGEIVEAAERTGVPAHVDWDVIGTAREFPESNVAAPRMEFTIAQLLRKMELDSKLTGLGGVTWSVGSDGIALGVTGDPEKRVYTRVYRVGDLVPDASEMCGASDGGRHPTADGVESVRMLVMSLVDPDAWVDTGGDTGFAIAVSDRLVVKQSVRNHLEIERVLGLLRSKGNVE